VAHQVITTESDNRGILLRVVTNFSYRAVYRLCLLITRSDEEFCEGCERCEDYVALYRDSNSRVVLTTALPDAPDTHGTDDAHKISASYKIYKLVLLQGEYTASPMPDDLSARSSCCGLIRCRVRCRAGACSVIGVLKN
jgi:hypothetical protein